MTKKEISKVDLFLSVKQKKMSQTKAAEMLGISIRQLQRLYKAFKDFGISSLISKKRGKPSNHQMPHFLKLRISELVTCEIYEGFGPTFMCEKLQELHGISVSRETTRQLMIENGVWKINKKRCPVIHQQRKRRARFGELAQIDGSPHAWFEDRGDPCVLLVFVDDATGRTYGKFFKSETTKGYMVVLREYIIKYGRPLALYSDKHGIFKINKPECLKKELITQFGRACKELEIQLICANSPQAKGRVERNNQTQQDRLVKELRLARINNIKDANHFLIEYWERFNKKFAVESESKKDAHRKLLLTHNLEKILCFKHQRTVSKNLEIQYKKTIYQIVLKNPSWHLRRSKVTVIEELSGKIHIEYKGKSLPFKIYIQQKAIGEEINSKEIDRFLKIKTERKVSFNHVWKQKGRAEAKMRKFQQSI